MHIGVGIGVQVGIIESIGKLYRHRIRGYIIMLELTDKLGDMHLAMQPTPCTTGQVCLLIILYVYTIAKYTYTCMLINDQSRVLLL